MELLEFWVCFPLCLIDNSCWNLSENLQTYWWKQTFVLPFKAQLVSTYRSPQSLWGGSSRWVWWVLKGQSEVTEGGWQRGRGVRGCLRCSPLLPSPSPSTEEPQQGKWKGMQQKHTWWHQQKSKCNAINEKKQQQQKKTEDNDNNR